MARSYRKLSEKYLIPIIATAEGHLAQERGNLQSTKAKKKTEIVDDNFSPPSDFSNVKKNEVVYCLTTSDDSKENEDLTG